MRPISVVGFKMMVVGYGLYSENPTNFYISYLYHLFILQHLYLANLSHQVVLHEAYEMFDCQGRLADTTLLEKDTLRYAWLSRSAPDLLDSMSVSSAFYLVGKAENI